MESFLHLALNLLVIKSIVNELLTAARIVIGAYNLVGYSRKNFSKLSLEITQFSLKPSVLSSFAEILWNF